MWRLWQFLSLFTGGILLILTTCLFVTRQQKPVERLILQIRENHQTSLSMLRLDGREIRQIAIFENVIKNPYVFWHPKGRWYVVQAQTVTGNQIFLGRIDGQYLQPFSQVKGTGNIALPLFSPDGRWVLVDERKLSGGSYGFRNLYILPLNSHRSERLLETGEIPTAGRLFWTSDSNWIIYEIPGNKEIYRIYRQGGSPQRIAAGELVTGDISGAWFTYTENSGTGQTVYRMNYSSLIREPLFHFDTPYTIKQISSTYDSIVVEQEGIFYLISDDQEPVALPIESNPQGYTDFSWQNEWLYFYEFTREGTNRIYRISADGSQILPLHDAATTDFITFTANQEWMLLYQNDLSSINERIRRLVRKKVDEVTMYPITDYYPDNYFVQNRFLLPEHQMNWKLLSGIGLVLLLGGSMLYIGRQ